MRLSFNTLEIEGQIMIGEGEKDDAPMLYAGEKLGLGHGPKVDIAVDPLEGTNLLANGRPNAISVVGVAPAGAMFDPGPSFYMQKLVVPSNAKDVVDIEAPTGHNLKLIARALDKDVDDLVVFVLDKPRHKKLISEIREAGARIQLHTDGDITGSLMAIDPRCEVDVMMGTGGTPEGVLSAIAIRIMGGEMFAKLDPQKQKEKNNLAEFGMDIRRVLDRQPTWSSPTTCSSRPPASPAAPSSRASPTTATGPRPPPWSCAARPGPSATWRPSTTGIP